MESDEKNIKCGAFSQQKFKNCHLKFFFSVKMPTTFCT